MITNVITLMIVFGLPALLIWAESRVKLIKWISPIILCYLAGIFIANTNPLNPDGELLDNLAGISVGLAIPLLLFSSDLKKWLGQATKTLLSFGIGVIGVVVASTLAYFIFSNNVENAEKVSGMMIGVYTGGTPNMAAIGKSLEIGDEVFVILNGADVIFSSFYLIFLLTIAKLILKFFLPAFKDSKELRATNGSFSLNDLKGHSNWSNLKRITFGVFMAGLLLGIGLVFAGQVEGNTANQLPWVILFITAGAIGLSFIPNVRTLRGTYKSAEYLLLVFALAAGCLSDLQVIMKEGPQLFLFCGFVVGLSIAFHFGFASIFKIDVDTVIITSTAAIYGPAFVGVVAKAIQNPKVIVSGITMGLLGYACANFLGIGVSKLLGLL